MKQIVDWLQIRPGEGRRTALLFLHLFAASGIFVLGRTVRDTLFLSRYSLAALPWLFVLYGIASSLVVILYDRYADRIARAILLYTTSAVGIVTYFITWLLVRAQISWIYPFFYIWAEVMANLFILQFWTLAGDFDPPRTARRLNVTIGAARPLSTIIFGFAVYWIVESIGTEQLLFVLMLLMLLTAVCVFILRHEPRYENLQESQSLEHALTRQRSPLTDRYFQALAALVLVMFVTLTLGDYQFKVIASSSLSEDSLARFFSIFYGVVGLLSVGFQVLVTPRLLSRLGVGSALTVMPGVFGTSSVALLFWPGLAGASAMKFSDNGLQFTLHDTTMQSLYAPFPASIRASTRGILEGAVKPLSFGVGGLLLVLLRYLDFDVRQMCFVTITLALEWQALVPLVRQHYLRSMERGLAGPMAAQLFEEPFVLGAAERKLLIRTLASPNPVRALGALEQLQGETSEEFREVLVGLLKRPESALRARAIQRLEALGEVSRLAEYRKASRDENPTVRAAAVAALARFVAEERPHELFPFMDDPSREVRIEVLAGLIRHGGVEGSARGGSRLLRLVESDDFEYRREACRVLSRLGGASYFSLQKLLQDMNPRVRRAAIRAAASTRDSRLAPFLIASLHDRACRNAVLSALAAMGEPAVKFIAEALLDPDLPRPIRLELPRVLSRIPSEDSFAALREFMEDPDSRVRLRVYAALGWLRTRLGHPPLPAGQILQRVKREVVEAYGNLLEWNQARERFETPLLSEAMHFRIRRAERRILRLLELAYDRRDIGVILNGLNDPARRSNALEALDALLDPPLRKMIVPLLEDRPPEGKTQLFNDLSLCVFPPTSFMLLQANHPNPYVALLGLDSLARAGEKSAASVAEQALHHRDPLVREGALRALAALDGECVQKAAAGLMEDPDPVVARWARYLLERSYSTDKGTAVTEETMYGTVEKILFLKTTPLFSNLPGEDLAPLARVVEVVAFSKGDTVFEAGDRGDHFYIVVSGLIALENRGREMSRVGPPNLLGELSVLVRGAKSSSARAVEQSELLRIGAVEFFEILHEQPEIADALLRLLATQLREAQEQLLKQAEALDHLSSPTQQPH